MSSFVRTMTKRILKRMGYTRQTQKVHPGDPIRGIPPHIVNLKAGEGDIIGPDMRSVGKHWPTRVPRIEREPRKVVPKPPRGRRRGKPSKWRSGIPV